MSRRSKLSLQRTRNWSTMRKMSFGLIQSRPEKPERLHKMLLFKQSNPMRVIKLPLLTNKQHARTRLEHHQRAQHSNTLNKLRYRSQNCHKRRHRARKTKRTGLLETTKRFPRPKNVFIRWTNPLQHSNPLFSIRKRTNSRQNPTSINTLRRRNVNWTQRTHSSHRWRNYRKYH